MNIQNTGAERVLGLPLVLQLRQLLAMGLRDGHLAGHVRADVVERSGEGVEFNATLDIVYLRAHLLVLLAHFDLDTTKDGEVRSLRYLFLIFCVP